MLLITREAPPAHFVFKIESFSLLNPCGIKKHETKEFVAGNYTWKLVIYPNGHGTGKEGEYVSVYLTISRTRYLPINWEVNAVFSIFILNQISGHYLHTPGKTSRFFALKKEWGIPNFISKEDLAIPSNGYLVDDSCLFGAEVFVIDKYSPVTECLSLKWATAPYKHSFMISNFSMLETVWVSEKITSAANSKWKIKMFPNGDTDEAGHSLSIYLCRDMDTSDERMRVSYTVCLKNHLGSGKSCKRTRTHWFDVQDRCGGWDPFITIAELNGEFIMDTCILEVEIDVLAVVR